jgi:HEAT repeat protein
MRIFALLVLAFALSGCSKPGPMLAGGKPIDDWIAALQGPDAKLRKTAAQKLGNVGSAHPAAFPAVHAALNDRDAGVRCEAILALLKFGPAAKDAVPVLDELRRRDPDAKVRDYAAKALAKLE